MADKFLIAAGRAQFLPRDPSMAEHLYNMASLEQVTPGRVSGSLQCLHALVLEVTYLPCSIC